VLNYGMNTYKPFPAELPLTLQREQLNPLYLGALYIVANTEGVRDTYDAAKVVAKIFNVSLGTVISDAINQVPTPKVFGA
jgi:hypothetical protein